LAWYQDIHKELPCFVHVFGYKCIYLATSFFRASYIEIYNEEVNDLLVKGRTDLKLREVEGTTIICGVNEEVVHTPDKVKIRFVWNE
jgi:hypothetical protein